MHLFLLHTHTYQKIYVNGKFVLTGPRKYKFNLFLEPDPDALERFILL